MSDCGLCIPDLSGQYAEARRIDPTMTSEKFAHRCGELMRMRALELINQGSANHQLTRKSRRVR